MIENNLRYFADYLKSFNVLIKENINNVTKEIDDELAINQIKLISDFSKISSSYNGIERKFFVNKTGVFIEEMKILVKKYKRYLKSIAEKEDISIVEAYILKQGEELLVRSENSVLGIKFNEYLKILNRTMERGEICLGNCYFNNISKLDGEIQIVSLKNMSLNFLEMDVLEFLRKLKRKNINIDFHKVIYEFCNYNSFGYESEVILKAMIAFPYDYLKLVNNYRIGKKNLSEEEFIEKLKKVRGRE